MRTKVKDEKTANELLDWLCKRFEIRRPNLVWDEKKPPMGWNLHNILRLGNRAYGDYSKTMLHEFAHILADRSNNRHNAHGKIFCETLFEVVITYYGDHTPYPWHREYKCVKAWYREHCNKPQKLIVAMGRNDMGRSEVA